jgi:hypothetical protein
LGAGGREFESPHPDEAEVNGSSLAFGASMYQPCIRLRIDSATGARLGER